MDSSQKNPVALRVMGIPIAQLTAEAALAEVERLYEAARPSVIAYVNAHSLNLSARDGRYADVLRRAALVLNDGAGVAIAGRLHKRPFPENLNGSDFNPRILEVAARRGWPVFFLGARAGIAAAAAERLEARIPGLSVVGVHDGYFDAGRSADVAAEIRASGAHVLLVAMGNPRQELWLDAHLGATGARLGIGVGAFFDFAAGAVPRAPQWMNRAGIEWVYRLGREPGRLWRRYVLGNPLFIARASRDAYRSRRTLEARTIEEVRALRGRVMIEDRSESMRSEDKKT